MLNIEKGKTYDAYEFGSGIKEDSITLKRNIFLTQLTDISDLVAMTKEDLELLLNENAQKEASIWNQMQKQAEEWEFFAAKRLMLQKAIKMKTISPVEHTSNVWQRDRDGNEFISNMVYHMSIRVYEDRTWVVEAQDYKTNAWYVTWDLWFNTPIKGGTIQNKGTYVAGVDRKRFTDHDAMLRYIAGRKKAYAKYFAEISPPIPAVKAHLFSICNALLPGYTLKGD